MGKFFKILGITIGIIIILLIIAGFAAKFFINPQNVKKMLSSQVKQRTGRTLVIDKLSWSLFPSISVQLHDVTLNNAPGFGSQPFLKLNNADVGAKLLPLLAGKLKTSKITVNGLTLNLMKNKKGVTNWDDLLGDQKDQTAKQAKAQKITKTQAAENQQKDLNGKTTEQFDFDIPSVDLRNVNINWFNEKTGQRLRLTNLNLETGRMQNQKPFPFSASINVRHNQPPMSLSAKLSGRLTLSPNKNYYALENGALNATLKNKSGTKRIKLAKINSTIQMQNNNIKLSPFDASLYGGRLTANADVNLQSKSPRYSLNGKLSNINIQTLLSALYGVNRLVGTGNINVNISTSGQNSNTLTRNLNGQGNFSLRNGKLLGIDVPFLVRTALSLINKKIRPVANQNETKFGILTGSFNIRRGIAYNQFSLASPTIQIQCKGSLNLISQRINDQCNATLVNGGQPIAQAIPVIISGPVSNPSFTPDVQGLLKETLKEQLPKIGKELLKGLFGN